MIVATYPSAERLEREEQAKKNVAMGPVFTPFELHQASKRNITPTEYRRRDAIIRNEASLCRLNVGQTCYPVQKKDYEKYGSLVVIGIARTYADFTFDDEWPKNDNPFLLTIAPVTERNKSFFCTRNWVTNINTHLNVTC